MEFFDAFSRPYCVYGHIAAHKYIYIGSGTISRAFSLNRTKLWDELSDGQIITVEIMEWFFDRDAAYKFEIEMIRKHNPACNHMHLNKPNAVPPKIRKPHRFPSRPRVNRAVRCVETGMVYLTSRAAYEALGVSQGAFSNVLNDRHKSIRGFTFVRHVPEI